MPPDNKGGPIRGILRRCEIQEIGEAPRAAEVELFLIALRRQANSGACQTLGDKDAASSVRIPRHTVEPGAGPIAVSGCMTFGTVDQGQDGEIDIVQRRRFDLVEVIEEVLLQIVVPVHVEQQGPRLGGRFVRSVVVVPRERHSRFRQAVPRRCRRK